MRGNGPTAIFYHRINGGSEAVHNGWAINSQSGETIRHQVRGGGGGGGPSNGIKSKTGRAMRCILLLGDRRVALKWNHVPKC